MINTEVKTHLVEGKKFPFCPGCGHTVASNALNKALLKLDIDVSKTVIVTDIGCVGLTDQYFNLNAFHGLHGRVITYATGLKLANPELEVIALIGDGGLGIGGNHFINAARRNIGITVLIFNNFNFGMTGGQHSVTTPVSGVTNTTPEGNNEYPVDICALVGAVNGSFAARTTVFDSNLADIISAAIKHRGFSAVDIWEPCTAYFAKNNEVDKTSIQTMMDGLGFKKGILIEKSRDELAEKCYQKMQNQKDKPGKKNNSGASAFSHNISSKVSIIVAGSAGERVISSSYLFAYSGILSGLYVTQKDDFPITVMTGYSVSEIIFDREEILYTEIDNPDYMLIISKNGFDRVKNRIGRNTFILADSSLAEEISLSEKANPGNIFTLPILGSARKLDKNFAVLIGLSALLQRAGLFDENAFAESIKWKTKTALTEKSQQALAIGKSLVMEKSRLSAS